MPAPRGTATFLNAERRRRELELVTDSGFRADLLVVGGGVTGCGVALDAASRGLSVVLLERRDLANGTSRWSSKLAHGGLRYLAKGDFGVAWESAQERQTLATVSAPHLIRALPQLIPVRGSRSRRSARLIGAGIHVGDGMRALSGTSRKRLPSMRRVTAAEASMWAPALSRDRLQGAILSWDAQLEDDARLVVALARTAAAHQARILTYCEVIRLTGNGAILLDARTGQSTEVRADQVVNATGVWADTLVEGVSLRPSRGSHLLVEGSRLGNPRAMLNVPDREHFGRFVFALPRPDGLVMIGLTDEPFQGGGVPDAPEVPERDTRLLLSAVSRALSAPLEPEDVVGSFAGLRPLLQGEAASTADLSRRHAVLCDPAADVVTVVGGKLTTYRRMAQDAVDVVAARARRRLAPCMTRQLQLVGAPAPGRAGTDDRVPAGLARRFGTEARELAELAADHPDLLEPVVEGSDHLCVELLAAVEREGALSAADVLERRLRLGLVPSRRAAGEAALARALPELTGLAVSRGAGR